MKAKSLLFSLGAALGLLCLIASESSAGVGWSVSIFDRPLGACGYWINDPSYGRCWHPAYIASNWYPYCEGYWMWTSCGWYWVSSEPWAWATYHYGRWAYDPYYGWVWAPDTNWGASWVCWREGGGYCGWAPLPPGAVFGPGGDIIYRNGPVADRFFVFVQLGQFSGPIHRRDVVVNNTTIINQTVNITKFSRVNNVVINNGPRVDEIQKFSTRKLTEAPPRAALTRSATSRYGTTGPGIATPNAAVPGRQPPKAGQTPNREPQVIRGGTGQGVYDYKQPGNQRAAPLPTVYKPTAEKQPHPGQGTYQNFGARSTTPYSPATPDSIQPRQHTSREPTPQIQPTGNERTPEKQNQSGSQPTPKKGPPGGN